MPTVPDLTDCAISRGYNRFIIQQAIDRLMPNPISHPPAPFNDRPWIRAGVKLPQDAAQVPTMLTPEEGNLLHWLTRDYATGIGAVCDLGCFAGGSTARLASGIAASGRSTQVHAFDHFTLTDTQKERYLYPAGIKPFDSPCMQHAVQHLLRPWRDIVTLRPGDITKARWRDGPIEILFIDAAKTPRSADKIAETFFPHLIPGQSIVVQQDYFHWRQPWVPAQMRLLSECFELVGWCAENTAIFRATETICSACLNPARQTGIDDDRMVDLIGQALCGFPSRPQRAHLARAILCVRDNPGIRIPHKMSRQAFTPARVTSVIKEMLKRFGP